MSDNNNIDTIVSHDTVLDEIRNKLTSSKYEEAYQILKRNPLVPLTLEDGIQFLNNLELLIPNGRDDDDDNKLQKQVMNL